MLKFYINNNGGANKNNNNEIIRSNNSNRNKNKLQTKHNKNYVGIKLMRFAVSLRNETLVSFCDPLGYFHIQTYLLTLLPTPNTFSNLFTNLSIYLTGRCLLWMETSVIGEPAHPYTRSSIISCTLDGALIIVKPSPLTLPGLLGHVCVYAICRRSFWLRFIMPSGTEFVYKHCNF